MSKFSGIKFDIFTQISASFCRNRRLRTFLKVGKKNSIHVQNEGGGGKGRLNNVKKTALLVFVGFPKSVVCLLTNMRKLGLGNMRGSGSGQTTFAKLLVMFRGNVCN